MLKGAVMQASTTRRLHERLDMEAAQEPVEQPSNLWPGLCPHFRVRQRSKFGPRAYHRICK